MRRQSGLGVLLGIILVLSQDGSTKAYSCTTNTHCQYSGCSSTHCVSTTYQSEPPCTPQFSCWHGVLWRVPHCNGVLLYWWMTWPSHPFECWSWFCLCFGRVTPTDVWCLPQRWRWWCVRNRRSVRELKFPSRPFACWSWFCLCFGRVTPTDVWCLPQRWRWRWVRNRRSGSELKFPSRPFACWSWFCLCFGRVTTGWLCSVLIHRSATLEVLVQTGKTRGETRPVSCVLLESSRHQLVRPPLFIWTWLLLRLRWRSPWWRGCSLSFICIRRIHLRIYRQWSWS